MPTAAETSTAHLSVGDTIPADVLDRPDAKPLMAPSGAGTVTGTWATKRDHGYTVEMPGYFGGKFVFSVSHDTLFA